LFGVSSYFPFKISERKIKSYGVFLKLWIRFSFQKTLSKNSNCNKLKQKILKKLRFVICAQEFCAYFAHFKIDSRKFEKKSSPNNTDLHKTKVNWQ
jgi:hypothetical protein